MVCREAGTHKAKKVHPLILTSDVERTLFQMGQGMLKNIQIFVELPKVI
jgi:hypothetical protein